MEQIQKMINDLKFDEYRTQLVSKLNEHDDVLEEEAGDDSEDNEISAI